MTTDTGAQENRTAAVDETTVPAEATAPPVTTEPTGVNLNFDLLNDLGSTFAEIQERRGELTKANFAVDRGAVQFKFENSPWVYRWYISYEQFDHEKLSWIKDGEGQNIYFLLDKNAPISPNIEKCDEIMQIPLSEMFLGLNLPASVSDIVEKHQIVHLYTWYDTFHGHKFESSFLHEDKIIIVSAINSHEEIRDILNPLGTQCQCGRPVADETIDTWFCLCGMDEIALLPLLTFDKTSTVNIRFNR
jgi:hypothetical protein